MPSKRITLQCPICHQEFTRYVSQAGRYCSPACAAAGHRRPDRYVMTNGYVSTRDESGNRIDEHRYVMEKHLGRKLRGDEHVHHINKDTTDNRVENLTVMLNVEHIRHHTKLSPGQWSRKYDRCGGCGTRDDKHIAHGLCARCLYKSRHHFKKPSNFAKSS